jgi:acid phosphatase family membrane protein YuiD
VEKIFFFVQGVGKAFGDIFTSRIMWACLTAWFLAAAIKMLLYYRQHQRLNFRVLVGTGGMPSSHSSFVMALATTVGMETGWNSPVFMLSLGFAIVTMNDAQGVRRASGHQASLLNRIVDDMYHQKPIKPERLKELLGHTPIQVTIGGIIGVITALVFYA